MENQNATLNPIDDNYCRTWSWGSAISAYTACALPVIAVTALKWEYSNVGPWPVIHAIGIRLLIWWILVIILRLWVGVNRNILLLVQRIGHAKGTVRTIVVNVVGGLLTFGVPAFLGYVLVLLPTKYGHRFVLTLLPVIVVVLLSPLLYLFLRVIGRWVGHLSRLPFRAGYLVCFLVSMFVSIIWARGTARFSRTYFSAHLLTGICLLAGSYFLFRTVKNRAFQLKTPRSVSGAIYVATGLAFVVILMVVPSATAKRLALDDPVVRAVLFSPQPFDSDGDGYGKKVAWAFGRDCDDRDPAVHPHAVEIVGNGIDDNCFGGELAELPRELLPPEHRPDGGFRGEPPKNILWLTIDSLRVEPDEPYGIDHEAAPFLASLAANSYSFTRLRSCATLTDQSFPLLLHGGPSLAEGTMLHDFLPGAGYHMFRNEDAWNTGPAPTPDYPNSPCYSRRHGRCLDDNVLIDAMITWFQEGIPQPFFLHLYLADIHWPHSPYGDCSANDPVTRRYHCLYRKTDENVRRLFEVLRETGLLESTVIAVTADHGEELGEHGAVGHAHSLYDVALRVPLLVYIDGESPAQYDAPMNCFDTMPTILEAAGAPIPPWFVGHSFLSDVPTEHHVQWARVNFRENALRAIIVDEFKMVLDLNTGIVRYYDLRTDPEELRPLDLIPQDQTDALNRLMDGWLSYLPSSSQW
ncbi:MAG: sulfatase-like hydrolase/transferase [Bradymonadales bacterium]|nr:sulfatase-like hydrolase/transferase [Bradymonadales bacterium]